LRKIQMLIFAFLLLPSITWADEQLLPDLNEEIVHVPMTIDSFWGKKEIQLTATIYRPQGAGPFSLIVLSHGSTKNASERLEFGRYRLIPQIREFIKRGFAVIVPIRRGYGMTGGAFAEDYGSCSNPTYYEAGQESSKDLVAAINFGSKLPHIKLDKILLVGQSGGGFASLAAASQNPQGVIGVVNFAGGRGGRADTNPGEPCCPERLGDAIRRFAKTIRVPVLWVYAENDKFFNPKHVQGWYQAFKDAGATGRLVIMPPFGNNGHKLFPSKGGIPIWTVEFDKFLTGILKIKF
jgi:dienelactone hydrolase